MGYGQRGSVRIVYTFIGSVEDPVDKVVNSILQFRGPLTPFFFHVTRELRALELLSSRLPTRLSRPISLHPSPKDCTTILPVVNLFLLFLFLFFPKGCMTTLPFVTFFLFLVCGDSCFWYLFFPMTSKHQALEHNVTTKLLRDAIILFDIGYYQYHKCSRVSCVFFPDGYPLCILPHRTSSPSPQFVPFAPRPAFSRWACRLLGLVDALITLPFFSFFSVLDERNATMSAIFCVALVFHSNDRRRAFPRVVAGTAF